ncbi:ATP-binding protein [Streptomyces naphthomycinicus]|uniref:ATP-binding protein n=1 Tax=Streptomyces naphthomycinicus TaxID=2872625 RepID=UPI001CECDC6C|nr:ATP-binding protein [Streptomyces sp. TML10]
MTDDRGTPTSARPWALEHCPEAAGRARTITQGLLNRWGVAGDVADSVLLTVSELVANAVQHAQPPLCLGLGCDPAAGRVYVEVSDGGPATEDGAAGLAEDEHGRGLMIVDRVAAAHGDRREAGQAVHWADIAYAA